MLGRNVTNDFHAFLFQGQGMPPMIDDVINTLFTTEPNSSSLKATDLKIPIVVQTIGWMGVLENKAVPATSGA